MIILFFLTISSFLRTKGNLNINMNKNDIYRKKILVDLDGVLNEYGNEGYDKNEIPQLKKGAREFLEKLSGIAELYLFTSRNLLESSKWLIDNKIDIYFIDVTNVKIPSYLYIDDRTICFRGDFELAYKEIINFKPYWKNPQSKIPTN